MSIRKPCVVANWKMQGSTETNFTFVEKFKHLLEARQQKGAELNGIDIVICPPAVYLQQMNHLLRATPLKLGAQNVYPETTGAYTGEISPKMLVDLNCQYVIIGHSERRRLLGEDDTQIARKCRAAYDAGLMPILCVGETQDQREAGQTWEVIEGQIKVVLEAFEIEAFERMLIAYEPVWAIGSGLAATPVQAQTVQAEIRALLACQSPEIAGKARILYGGSVTADTAAALFSQPDIDGGLIGGASLQPETFFSICQTAEKEDRLQAGGFYD